MWTSKGISRAGASQAKGQSGKGKGRAKGGYLDYFEKHLANPEYYSKNGKAMGEWVGGLAKKWGVEGQAIESKDALMYALNEGKDLEGNKLTERTPEYSFFDFQVSAQKSVSVMYSAFGDNRLMEAHEAASKEAFQHVIEQFAGFQDKSDGKSRKPDFVYVPEVIAGRFTHGVGRELDPQLHSHYVMANVVYGPDGKGHAIDRTRIFDSIRAAGKFYQSRMAEKVQELGYDIVQVREKGLVTGFEIAGVSERVIDIYSKRRKAIEAAIAEFVTKEGRQPSTAEKSIIASETRKDIKVPGFAKKDLKFETANERVASYQRSQLSEQELATLDALKERAVARSQERSPTLSQELAPMVADRAVRFAVEHLAERKTVRERHEILAEALNQAQGSATVEDIKTAMEKMERQGEVLHIARDDAQGLAGQMVTPDAIQREIFAVEYINNGVGACQKLMDVFWPLTPETCGDGMRPLSVEQNGVVQSLCECEDKVMAVRGVAGAGKTTTLKHFDRLARQNGKKVFYCAPTTSATSKIASEIEGANCLNTMSFINSAKNPRNAHKYRDGILVIDEAGLKSNKQGVAILKLVEKLNLRLVMVGDALQHKSVESGDFFRVAQRHSSMKTFTLSEIFRQTNKAYKAAVEQLAQGQYATGVEMINKLGWVHESEDYMKGAAHDWLARNALGETSVVSCPTWAEIGGVTLAIRDGLKRQGLIGKEDVGHVVTAWYDWTDAQKADVRNYRAGMLVTATRTTGTFKEGRTAEIVSIEGNVIKLSNGSQVNIKKSSSKLDVAEPRDIKVANGEKLLIHQNLSLGKEKDPKRDLINGEFLTVSHHDKEGNIVTAEGKVIPHWFMRWGHGYAATTHKVQGLSVTSTVMAAASLAGDAAYVGCSRGQESMSLHTPHFGRLKRSLKNDGSRLAALDILDLENAKLREREAAAIRAREPIMREKAIEAVQTGQKLKSALRFAGDIYQDMTFGRISIETAYAVLRNRIMDAGMNRGAGTEKTVHAPGMSPNIRVPEAGGREPGRESGISR